jgi:hypothetical protein
MDKRAALKEHTPPCGQPRTDKASSRLVLRPGAPCQTRIMSLLPVAPHLPGNPGQSSCHQRTCLNAGIWGLTVARKT